MLALDVDLGLKASICLVLSKKLPLKRVGDGVSKAKTSDTHLLSLTGLLQIFLLDLLLKEMDCELAPLLIVGSSSFFKNFTIEKTAG